MVLKKFLTGDVYARSRDVTLSIPDWEYYKAVILIKSSFFEETGARGGNFEEMLKQVLPLTKIFCDYFHDLIKVLFLHYLRL